MRYTVFNSLKLIIRLKVKKKGYLGYLIGSISAHYNPAKFCIPKILFYSMVYVYSMI